MTINGTSTRPPKAALLVAQRIVQDALREGRKPGDLLAPERTMLEKYQTGRGTLREALRLLEFRESSPSSPDHAAGRCSWTRTRRTSPATSCCSCS